MRFRTFLSVLLAALPLAALAQDLTVEVPRVVAVGENFKVEFSILGDDVKDFSWSQGEAFDLVWGPMTGTSIQIVNGDKSVKKSYTYVIVASEEGNFTIPSATAVIGGKECRTSPVQIEVIKGNQPASSAQGDSGQTGNEDRTSSQDVFLRLYLDKTNVVVGEPVIATLKLYTNADLNGFESVSFPTFDGFWSQEIEAPVNLSFQRENVDGRLYQSALLRRYLLVPQQSGTITIDPAEMVAVLIVRSAPRSGASIFDSFFDNYQQKRKRISTPPVSVKVRPLPSGAPASFSGAVGNYSIRVIADKDTLKQNEASSIRVELSGTGNLSLAGAPQIKLPSDFEQYDMKVTDPASKSISGKKVFEYPFIPRSSGTYTIPVVEYTYFSSEKGRYVTLKSDPFEIYVLKDETNQGVAGPSSVGRKSVRNLNEDIRFISVAMPEFKVKDRLFVLSGTFFTVLALIVVIAAVVVALGLRHIRRSADIKGQRNRKAEKMAMKRLKVSESYLRQNLYSAFYEELHKALLGYISDKLSIRAADMSRDNIRHELLSRGVAEEAADRFMSLVDACEFARYAPDSDNNAMHNHYNDAISVISAIDGMISGKKRTKTAAALVAALFMVSVSANAADADLKTLWDSANKAYTEGEWQVAVDSYNAILEQGVESASLYYNLGNAYYKSGHISGAIISFERAARLDPSDKDIQTNLQMARDLTVDRIEQVPDFILASWMGKLSSSLSSDTWAWLFLCAVTLLAASVCVFMLARDRRTKKASFISVFPLIILAVAFISFSLSQRSEYLSEDEAVVVATVSSVRSSPSDDNTKSLFILHEGTHVTVLEDLGPWMRVEIADGRQGWIERSDIEII